MDDRILLRVVAEHHLQTLTEQERRTDTSPTTTDPRPKRCKAWVRFGPHAVQVDGVVVKWTEVACGIEFRIGDQEHRCWVWANAVTPMVGAT